ncbi:MAG TPA: hypothetical protein VF052_10050, partial [Solirubrobacterales bacterium]
GTKAAAGLATAAIIAGGAAEIKHVTIDKEPKAPAKEKATPVRAKPAVIPATPPAEPAAPAQSAETAAAAVTDPAPETVTVPPQPTDPATTPETGGATPLPGRTGKRKRRKPIANTDSHAPTAPQTGPVTTGVEPASSCDADGDGAPDAGATCSGDSAVTTGLEEGTVEPAPYVAPPKTRPAKKKSTAKKRSARKKRSAKK